METRARYILVGIFTLLSAVAAMGFVLWLARVEINRTYAQYDIIFDTVAGLSQASVVRYNGVDVGTVLTIALDRDDPALVRVRIEIFATTPVRVDTIATLASQGVTGVSFVALDGGSPTSPRLTAERPALVPLIKSKPSVVQELTTAAPDLLKEAIALMDDIRGFTTPENRVAIAAILRNVKDATDRIDALSLRAETLMTAVETTLARADTALGQAETAFASADTVLQNDIPGLVDELKATAAEIGASAGEIKAFAKNDLRQFTGLVNEASRVLDTINSLAKRVGKDPGRALLGNQTPEYRN